MPKNKKQEKIDNLISPEAEVELDTTLRPKMLKDFLGQTQIVSNLKVFISAAKKRNEPLDHVLLYGPPGIGKTTLANIIANEYGAGIKITSGPALERVGDLAAILTNLENGDILFIDEIHRLSKPVEEVIYPAMEDFALDIILGKGPAARTVRLDLPKFTLIGATTRVGKISSPLRDRFGLISRLNYYSIEELAHIILRSAKILNTEISKEVSHLLAERSRGTPRIANRLVKRLRDFSEVQDSELSPEFVEKTLDKLGINKFGLDKEDLKYLETIEKKFEGGPVGLSTLAASLSEDPETIEDVIEPYLLQLGLIKRTGKGRVLASKNH